MAVANFALLQAALLLGAGTVENDELGFRFALPDGFAEIEHPKPDVVHCYRQPTDDGVGTVLAVERLGGTIGRKPLPDDFTAEDGTPVELYDDKWGEFTVQVFRVKQQVEGVECISLAAQIPLQREAIQVILLAEASREQETRKLLHDLLASLKGESNWLTAHERRMRIMQVVVPAVVAVIVVVILWRSRRRTTPTEGKALGPPPPPPQAK